MNGLLPNGLLALKVPLPGCFLPLIPFIVQIMIAMDGTILT